jgi:hypothetical protein
MIEESGSGAGSIPLNSGFGFRSGRSKTWIQIRTRIRIRNTGLNTAACPRTEYYLQTVKSASCVTHDLCQCFNLSVVYFSTCYMIRGWRKNKDFFLLLSLTSGNFGRQDRFFLLLISIVSIFAEVSKQRLVFSHFCGIIFHLIKFYILFAKSC